MSELESCIDRLALDELTKEIKRTMKRSAQSVVQVGYMLRHVLEKKLWAERFNSFDEYLSEEFKMDYSLANRFININKKYSRFGNGMTISTAYEDYSQGLLIEMLSMPPELESRVTPDMTVKQVREMKRQAKEVKEPEEKEEIIIDGEFREITEPVAMSQQEQLPTDGDNLTTVKYVLKQEQDLLHQYLELGDIPERTVLRQKILVGALASFTCDLEQIEQEKREQPELPIFKNNDERKAWLADYKSWGLWYHDEHIDVNYYKYDFQDGTRLVVEENLQVPSAWERACSDHYYFHLLEKGVPRYGNKGKYDKKYNHSTDSETYLVEFMKRLQKGKK